MLTKRIIPCLDVDCGRVVKGTNFVDIVDAGDPVEAAIRYDEQGADELVFLDITASSGNRKLVFDIVEKTAKKCFMPLTVGGGIRNTDDIKKVLNSGGDKVAINTAAINNPKIINSGADAFGSQCIVVAMDVKKICRNSSKDNSEQKWQVFSHGGRKNTGIDAIEWAKECADRGAGEILLTSMDADGTQNGYDLDITSKISEMLNIPVIASGGAGKLNHILDAFTKGKADAVLAASIFHFNKFSINDVKGFLSSNGVLTRQ